MFSGFWYRWELDQSHFLVLFSSNAFIELYLFIEKIPWKLEERVPKEVRERYLGKWWGLNDLAASRPLQWKVQNIRLMDFLGAHNNFSTGQ